jgi:mediator of RNA polymerase II transcription subunit 17, fungi type
MVKYLLCCCGYFVPGMPGRLPGSLVPSRLACAPLNGPPLHFIGTLPLQLNSFTSILLDPRETGTFHANTSSTWQSMAAGNSVPFSLRPWPTGDRRPKDIGEFISRINTEGGFRNITETELREEIKAQEEGRDLDNGDGASEVESRSDEEEEADKAKPIEQTKMEVIRQIDQAHQSAMQCLDFVSLLLSKDNPNVAGASMSQALRDLVGIGTMGASKLDDSNFTEARANEDRAVATGWRMMGISRTVDSLIAAAERLEKEITLETDYWADVLAVSENGWAVSAMPEAPHTLGVRFGFSEAAPEYRDNSVAPLLRNEDGALRLSHGRVGRGSQRIRVMVQRGGEVIGRSILPATISDNAPLQDRVLEARNTIFSQELWYELNREARTLVSFGVQSDGTSITYDLDASSKITITIEDLGDAEGPLEPSPDGKLAEMTTLALHLYLIYAHRLSYDKRTQALQQAPSRINLPYNLLRPLISRFELSSAYDTLTSFLTALTSSLHQAGVSTASFTTSMPLINVDGLRQGQQYRHSPRSELLLQSSMHNPEPCSAEIVLTPEAIVSIRGESVMFPFIATLFHISLPKLSPDTASSKGSEDQPKTRKNILEDVYPPHNAPAAYYPDVGEVIYYIRQAAIRALSEKLVSGTRERGHNDNIRWVESANGPVMVDHENREASLDISADGAVIGLEMKGEEGKKASTQRFAWGNGVGETKETLEQVFTKMFEVQVA